MKLALPETKPPGPNLEDGHTCCTPEDEFIRGLDDFDLNYLDNELPECGIFDNLDIEATGCGQVHNINAQPLLRDMTSPNGMRHATSELPPFGSLAVDALFQSSFTKPATVAAPDPLSYTTGCAIAAMPSSPHARVPEAVIQGVIQCFPQSLPEDSARPPSPVCISGCLPSSPLQGRSYDSSALESVLSQARWHPDTSPPAKSLPTYESVQQQQQQQLQPQCTPALLPAVATHRRVANRSEIATVFAEPPVDQFVLFCSQAPKRKAETEAESEDGRSDSACSSPSDGSHTMTADNFSQELIAPSLSTVQEVEQFLHSIPGQQETADGNVVYMMPTLWRSLHPPFRIHVSVGLHVMRALSAEAPATYYGSLNPRIVTTGVSRQQCRGSLHNHAETAPPLQTRASRKAKAAPSKTADTGSRDSHTAMHSTTHDPSLLEIWLLQRSLMVSTAGEVLNSHRLTGRQCTPTITGHHGPQWQRGEWAVDIVAKVAAFTGQTFWLKAVNRAVQEAAADAA